MEENPYQSPSIPAEPQRPPRSGPLPIDWYGIGRAVLVLIVAYIVMGVVSWLLPWLTP